LSGTREDLDDDHATAAAWAWRAWIGWRSGFFGLSRRRHREQLPGKGDIGLAAGAGEQAVVTDPVEALRQNMEQEATDELVGAERRLRETAEHLREDVSKVQDPRAQALFETAAEVLGGLEKAFRDYDAGTERAWKR
jgi:hypothetical protein